METVKHAGKLFFFRKTSAAVGFKRCALCGEFINSGQPIFRISSNTPSLFPNTQVHKDCTIPHAPFDKNNPFVWTIGQLAKSWKEAQQYKHWFGK